MSIDEPRLFDRRQVLPGRVLDREQVEHLFVREALQVDWHIPRCKPSISEIRIRDRGVVVEKLYCFRAAVAAGNLDDGNLIFFQIPVRSLSIRILGVAGLIVVHKETALGELPKTIL